MNNPIQLKSALDMRLLALEEACDLRLDGGLDPWGRYLASEIGSFNTTGEKQCDRASIPGPPGERVYG